MNARFERRPPDYKDFPAKLIWHPAEREVYYDTPRDSWCMFRKVFSLQAACEAAIVRIFADTRYILYVNGIECSTGPARSDPRWQYYDELDISANLHDGTNCIAVLVLYHGYSTGQSISRIPALYADVAVTENGQVQHFSSDRSWKCKLLKAHDKNAPRVNGCKGRIEVFDNRLYDENWTNVSYNDSDWVACHERGRHLSPFWNLNERKIGLLQRNTVSARAIVYEGSTTTAKTYDLPQLHRQIMQESDTAQLHPVTKPLPYGFQKPAESQVQIATADFGSIYVGCALLEVDGHDGDVLDIVYAEELFDAKPYYNGISYRPISRFILREGYNRLPIFFGYEAFRYILLFARAAMTVRSVSVYTREYPFAETASFTSENPQLNRLWNISAHTLEICLQDGYLDSPSREQQQWMGDARYQAIMSYYYSAETYMAEKVLRQFAQSQDFEGMTAARYPDGHHNYPPIPSYCLQWICAFADYYRFTGKTELIQSLYPNILLAVRWFSAFEGDDGLLYDLPYWNYCDLGTNASGRCGDFDRGGTVALLDMMYAEALQAVALIAELMGDTEAVAFFTAKYDRLVAAIREKLWHPAKGAYADCLVGGVLSDSVSESVNALAVILFERGARADKIFESVFNPRTRLADVVEVGVYMMILLSRALKALGKEELSVDLFLQRYAEMLSAGTDTTWEHWHLVDRDRNGRIYNCSSACHAWGASAIVLVAENILGIDPGDKTAACAVLKAPTVGAVKAAVFAHAGKRIVIK